MPDQATDLSMLPRALVLDDRHQRVGTELEVLSAGVEMNAAARLSISRRADLMPWRALESNRTRRDSEMVERSVEGGDRAVGEAAAPPLSEGMDSQVLAGIQGASSLRWWRREERLESTSIGAGDDARWGDRGLRFDSLSFMVR